MQFTKRASTHEQRVLLRRLGKVWRRENSLEVQWICLRDTDRLGRSLALAAELAKQLDRLRQRELFAGETADESSPANFAAKLHAAIDPRQREPGDRNPLARDRPSEDDARARQQLSRDHLVKFFR